MSFYVIDADKACTVHEMRQMLARMLAPLEGDQPVHFKFVAKFPEYKTALTERHSRKNPILGAPYDVSNANQDGLWGTADQYTDFCTMDEAFGIVYGPLARPENN